ncbi:NEDD8 activating enzyme [Coemansia sp. RSA 1797]|nr:NEDD8 activating enzyme [Coemansia sp. RSA 1797]
MYTGDDGVYFLAYPLFQSETCIVCGQVEGSINAASTATLEELIDSLKENSTFQLKAPSLMFGNASLYFQNPKMLEEQTRPNLSKSLTELFDSGSTLTVTDPTLPTSLRITVIFTDLQA